MDWTSIAEAAATAAVPVVLPMLIGLMWQGWKLLRERLLASRVRRIVEAVEREAGSFVVRMAQNPAFLHSIDAKSEEVVQDIRNRLPDALKGVGGASATTLATMFRGEVGKLIARRGLALPPMAASPPEPYVPGLGGIALGDAR